MDKKWSIMDKKDISDKCCQMENDIWNIFQSPSSWINGMNGFIRLVSMDGTWYHHRATDVFIPMAQTYMNRLYRLDTRPERGAIRVRSGTIYWDYLNQEEALQILPNLPTSNLPNAAEAAGLEERCRNKKIFLKDGSVYDMENKIIRPLQWNEEGSVLQICHLEDKHKRNNAVLWHYDIYLWAKAGIIPSVLYAARECWNTMQFLIDNFNKIDFDDFLSLSGMNETTGVNPESSEFAEKESMASIPSELPIAEDDNRKQTQSDALETAIATKAFEQANNTMEPEPAEVLEDAAKKVLEQSENIIEQQSFETLEEAAKSDLEPMQDKEEPEPVEVLEAAAENDPEPIQDKTESEPVEVLEVVESEPEPMQDKEEPEPVEVLEAVESEPEPMQDKEEPEPVEVLEEAVESEPEPIQDKEEPESVEVVEEIAEKAPEPLQKNAQESLEVMEETVGEKEAECTVESEPSKITEQVDPIEVSMQPESMDEISKLPETENVTDVELKAESSPNQERVENIDKSADSQAVKELSTISEIPIISTEDKVEDTVVDKKAAAETKLQAAIKPEIETETKPQATEKLDISEPLIDFGKEETIVLEKEATVLAEEMITDPENAKTKEKQDTFALPNDLGKQGAIVSETEMNIESEIIEEAPILQNPETETKQQVIEKAEDFIKSEMVMDSKMPEDLERTFVLEEISEQETVAETVIKSEQNTLDKPEEVIEEEKLIKSEPALQPEGITEPKSLSAQDTNAEREAFITSDYPAKLEQTTKQLEKKENMDIVQGEDITVTTDKIQALLDCDKNRCRLEPYDKDILYDIIRGHWELYEDGADNEAKQNIKMESEDGTKEFIARNPKQDVKQGVVGIDFGTKSTVVVRQDATNRIVPIRIGTGNLSSEVKEEDFENPSIIEFTNVKKFLEDYQREVGRPHTSCNDIFVSYDAYEDFRNCKPDDFYAYFNELKQWANHEKGNVVIKDKQKIEYYMGENMGEAEDIVNPVELYAYYIGLHINNMRNGIYLKYLMTFPVGYAKEVRDFIADSFYKGIKKSLPTSIINDEECMAQFKVSLGISEPAAYAVTALEQNHLEPKDETEQLRYGIFDFGGGTTDFDFGICRGATDEEYENDAYDYVLECFGADSDVTLGGENILELMAYQVYQKNIDVFREKKITFTLPVGESSFAGSETLLIDSQIAKRNMAILKEELRPLWHQEQGWRKKYELENEVPNEVDKEGVVVSLYNMDGEPVPQCMLEFSTQEMVEMIKNRIQKGIDSFFQCLIKIFLYKKEDVAEEEPTIYIFLSGNSSKSIFVKELFQKKIEEYYSKARKAGDEMGNAHFELFEPLVGTQDGSGYYVPNAKTGVAYGLLKSREGSSIKIVKNYETDAQQQSRFRYYLGRDRRHYFDCKFSPAEISYKKWVSFQGASRGVVRIYYTDNPVADSKLEQLSIENVPYKEITITPEENAFLFIRTVEPNLIEYAVAKEEGDITESDIKNCYFT